jgi:predicted nicotinamide N-methyase
MSDMPLIAEMETSVQRAAGRVLSGLAEEVQSPSSSGMDRLAVMSAPLVPEIKLHLAEDAILLWARLEAQLKTRLTAPFWASAWVGGQGLARYILDHPEVARGRRVLDLGSGSGLVAIAAAMAGAREVVANDIDPYAMSVIEMNAHLNHVQVTGQRGSLLNSNGSGFDAVYAGDALYDGNLAGGVLPFLRRVTGHGGEVLIGDPRRGHLPDRELRVLATYQVTTMGALADSQIDTVTVFRMEPASGRRGVRLARSSVADNQGLESA